MTERITIAHQKLQFVPQMLQLYVLINKQSYIFFPDGLFYSSSTSCIPFRLLWNAEKGPISRMTVRVRLINNSGMINHYLMLRKFIKYYV